MKKIVGSAAALTALLVSLTACVPMESRSAETEVFSGSFETQEVAWYSCDGLECADIKVPVNWDNPDLTNTYDLHLVRAESYSSEPVGTIFINPGGPGASGTEYLATSVAEFDELRNNYDIVSWDPRGVDSSTPVLCLSDSEKDEDLYGNKATPAEGSEEWLAKVKNDNEELAKQCEENSGDVIRNVSTDQTVQDLEMLRQVMGDDKLNYMGFSYGTFIGARYADKYPETVGKMILDGAIDPLANTGDVVFNQTLGFEKALRNYLTDCVQKNSCWYQGDVAAGEKRVSDLLAKVAETPLEASDGRWVTDNVLLTAIVTPLYSEDSWPFLTRLFEEIENGETETALLLADFYNDRDQSGTYKNNSQEAFFAINCSDYVQREPDLEQMRADAAELAKAAPIFGKYQGYADAGCWGWPVSTAERGAVTASGAAPIVVIGTTGDPATPFEWSVSLAEQLESGVHVTYEGEGHVAFGTSECVSELATSYFVAGAVPAGGTVCKQ